ncbi:MAG TPA: preprotein translocase subunit YajC [Chitinophagales bacterium]|nr:preprotein translocase subunit YajC [Chitinophagales bacterium]
MYNAVLLMADPNGQSSDGSGFTTIGFFLLFFVILYFFMIRPQTKKAKDQKNFLGELKAGDKIVTIGGVHARIAKVEDETLLVEVDNNVKLRIEKSVISLDYTRAAQNRNSQQS